jgi:linoleoyl-CoA desaturase
MEQTKIKYTTENNLEFIKELKAKVKLYFESNNISKFGNPGLVVKSIFMFLLYLTPYVLMITGVIDSFLGVLACWVIIGIGKAGVGMVVMHDANHKTYARNMNTNKWLAKSLYLLGGFPPNWKRQHNTLHHGFPNIEGHDEDISPGSFLRFSPHKPLLKMHKFQHLYAWFFYGLMTFSWATIKDFKQLFRYKRENVQMRSKQTYPQLLILLILSKILYHTVFLVIPIIVLPFAWYWIIVFFMAMHFTSGFLLGIIFQTAHVVPTSEFPLPDDTGTIENSWAVHQLFNTSDFAPKNKVLTWLIGGLNFQVEHHLFPGVCHVHYHKIAHLVKETAQKYGLPYHVQPTFVGAVWEHAKMLKKLGRNYSI